MEGLITQSGIYDMSPGIYQSGGSLNVLLYKNEYIENIDYMIPEPMSYRLSDREIVEIEKKMYEQNKERYLDDYEGKYIALQNGEILDSDSDFSNLATRVYQKHGYIPVYMPQVLRKERVSRSISRRVISKKAD